MQLIKMTKEIEVQIDLKVQKCIGKKENTCLKINIVRLRKAKEVTYYVDQFPE